jgi:predicted Zn-dependent peptidase
LSEKVVREEGSGGIRENSRKHGAQNNNRAAQMNFYQTTLANGLTVIAEERPTAVSSALGFFVRTGARDETPELSGVSHFLEHMVFKGSEKRSALDITYQLSALGAQSNAFTSEENTVYYLSVLPEYLPEAFEILADMMRPTLDANEFATEKKVILEEIALYRDRPTHVLFEASVKEFFRGHQGGNSVLGSTESITALTVEQMRGYFNHRYSPSNIVLAASGKIQWEEIVELAERYCGTWRDLAVTREVRPHHPVESAVTLTREDLQIAHLCFLSAGPAADDADRYAAQVLTSILGDSSGSRAYWELVDKGLADSASIDGDEMDGTGFIMGYVSSLPDRIDEVGAILRHILETPLEFNADQLERAKTKLRTRLVLQGESSMRRLMAIGLEWLARRGE